MFKLIAFFAILAAAFAVPAPQPNPKADPLTLYSSGVPLAYNSYQYQPLTYSNLGYNYYPYAYNYNYYNSPLSYRNLYY